MDEWQPMKKIQRQLLIYHICSYNSYFRYDTLEYWLCMDKRQLRTFYRDIRELREAGLADIRYDTVRKEYHTLAGCGGVDQTAQGHYLAHLTRLNRMGRLMMELEQDPVDETVLEAQIDDKEWFQQTFKKEDYIDVGKLFSAKDCYQKLFPNLSERTMQRDFGLLCSIGYLIEYVPKIHYYHMDFPNLDLCVNVINNHGKLYISS